MQIKIAVVDDHDIILEGLEIQLRPHYRSQNIYGFTNANDLLEGMASNDFDLIILDIQLPDKMAFSLVPMILKIKPKQKIIIFSMYSEELMAEPMFDLGAMGYINKKDGKSDIVRAVQTVLNGQRYMSTKLNNHFSNNFLNRTTNQSLINKLSKRELEITVLLIQGQGVSEISEYLDLKTSTVGTYKKRIFQKFGVNNIIALYHKSMAIGLI